jgi:hypothetical protein
MSLGRAVVAAVVGMVEDGKAEESPSRDEERRRGPGRWRGSASRFTFFLMGTGPASSDADPGTGLLQLGREASLGLGDWAGKSR